MNPTSHPGTSPAEQLSAHIEQDIATCETLLQLLAAEREALQERDLNLLDDIIKQKTTCLQSLEAAAQTRTRWVQAANTKRQPPETVWQNILATTSAELQDRWQELKQLFGQCQMQNAINGKVLARKQATYGQLLNIVRGQPNSAKLYTAKGAAGQAQSGFDLGQA